MVCLGGERHTRSVNSESDDLAAQRLFAANMKRLRKERGLTQERLAELAGLHINYVSSCERGERNISIRNIAKIALAFGVPMSVMVDEGCPLAMEATQDE